jgi:hypothetical protein
MGRTTAIALIGFPLPASELNNIQRCDSVVEVVRPNAFVFPENWTTGKNKLSSKRHPVLQSGAKALRILRISLIRGKNTSFVFSKAQSSPGEPQYFSAVGGARAGCYEAPTPRPGSSLGSAGPRVGAYLSSFNRLRTQGKILLPPLHFLSTHTIGNEIRGLVGPIPIRNRKSQGYSCRQLSCQPAFFSEARNSGKTYLDIRLDGPDIRSGPLAKNLLR